LLEVAVLLKVAENTVYTMAHAVQIAAFKVRSRCWFKGDNILRWIDELKPAAKWNVGKDAHNG
jgi:hypothetical protein